MGALTAATSASLNTAFCSLASSTLLGWQKANPELSADSLTPESAFRLVVGVDRDPPFIRDSFKGLQTFLQNLVSERFRIGSKDPEVPDWFVSALSYTLPERRGLGASEELFEHMVTGIQNLFDLNYPKVRERHLIIHDAADNALFVAADYLVETPLLPCDRQRGELLQLSLDLAPSELDRVLNERWTIEYSIVDEILKRFPFVARDFVKSFVNGKLVRVTFKYPDLDPSAFREFFLSEHGRFVSDVTLTPQRNQFVLNEDLLLTRLFQGEWARSLRRLDLFDCCLGAKGARAIADSQTLSHLTTLNLRDNDIGVEGRRLLHEWAAKRGVTVHL